MPNPPFEMQIKVNKVVDKRNLFVYTIVQTKELYAR